MRRSTRNKLRKLEELAIMAMAQQRCHFCHRPLIVTPPPHTSYRDFLSGTDKKQLTQITVHHTGGHDYASNWHARRNQNSTTFTHTRCHRAHHAREIFHSDR